MRAWTVWVRPGDAETAAALREAGHRLDGEPALMVGTLADMDLEPRRELDLVRAPAWEVVGAINDAAWGHGGDTASPRCWPRSTRASPTATSRWSTGARPRRS